MLNMRSNCTVSVLLSWQLPSILANQACYWPNGTENALVNCYSSQTSICCAPGDMCMSNGLCIGGALGMVWIMYSLYALNSDLRIPHGTKTDPKMQAYRGGCTDKNWSNTTTCPDWCNDREHDAYLAVLACLSSRTFSQKFIEADDVSRSVYPGVYSNIFRCPGTPWVYCNKHLSSPCQSGTTGLEIYTGATILGTPPISSTEQVTTATPCILTSFIEQLTIVNSSMLTTSTSITESAASSALISPPRSTQIIHKSSQSATAIGVGLGVPFGIAAIGFTVFLFWRDARRKNARGLKQDTSRDKRIRRQNTLTGGEMDGNGLRLELQGSIMTPELHGNEPIQQPNGIAPPALEPIQPLMLGERPLD